MILWAGTHNGCRLQDKCHPQTIAVCQSRAEGLGLEAVVISEDNFEVGSDVSGVLIQYPATDGSVSDYSVRPFLVEGNAMVSTLMRIHL